MVLVGEVTEFEVDARVYRLAAVKKTAYRMADRFTVAIVDTSEHKHRLEARFKPGASDEQAREAVRAFHQELLDQELREQIAEETAPVRALVMAHAFSKADLIKRDE
jgi:His-Xaa-Ser system protein HxsD